MSKKKLLRIDTIPGGKIPMDFRIADCVELWDKSFSLVYDCYLEKGLITPNAYSRRVTEYHLQPQTNVFVAICGGEVVATATLVNDTPRGMPVDDVYPGEIDGFRSQGISMAEVTCLACKASSFRESHQAMIGMIRILAQHSSKFKIDQLVAAVHPRHAQFYVRTMGFNYFGNEKQYENLHNAPAVGCFMNFREVEREHPPYFEKLLGNPMPLIDLLPRPMTSKGIKQFENMVSHSELLVPCSI